MLSHQHATPSGVARPHKDSERICGFDWHITWLTKFQSRAAMNILSNPLKVGAIEVILLTEFDQEKSG